jgi:hypothetical protein
MTARWLVLLLLVFVTACSKTPQEPRYVPVEPGRVPVKK